LKTGVPIDYPEETSIFKIKMIDDVTSCSKLKTASC